jgi:hypothetical protein
MHSNSGGNNRYITGINQMIYELRRYYIEKSHIDEYKEWAKTGVLIIKKNFDLVGYWIDDGETSEGAHGSDVMTSEYTYPSAVWLLRWDSKQERDERWHGEFFETNAEWLDAWDNLPGGWPGYFLHTQSDYVTNYAKDSELTADYNHGIYEIRNYHFDKSKIEQYREWAKTAVPIVEENFDLIGFYLEEDATSDGIQGSAPITLKHGQANVVWILRWESKEKRDEIWYGDFWETNQAWLDAWEKVPGGWDSYLHTQSNFAVNYAELD